MAIPIYYAIYVLYFYISYISRGYKKEKKKKKKSKELRKLASALLVNKADLASVIIAFEFYHFHPEVYLCLIVFMQFYNNPCY